MRKNSSAIEQDIINSHNAGNFRDWERRKTEINSRWDEFPDAGHNPYPYKSTPVNWRQNPLIVENRQEFDLVHALEDSGQEKQYEFDFDADPEDKKFSDDVREGQSDL